MFEGTNLNISREFIGFKKKLNDKAEPINIFLMLQVRNQLEILSSF